MIKQGIFKELFSNWVSVTSLLVTKYVRKRGIKSEAIGVDWEGEAYLRG